MITNIKIIIISLTLLVINSKYCSKIVSPIEPNDCTLFSYEDNKCCFCKGNTNKCVLNPTQKDSSDCKELMCEDDFFYNFTLDENKPTNNNKCTFKYGNIKGSFKYSGNQTFEFMVNDLQLDCQRSAFINISYFSLLLILLYT